MIRKLVVLLFISMLSYAAIAQSPYAAEIAKWRAAHQADLLTDDGWLTVAGLFWLKEGVNTVGSRGDFNVELTNNFKKGKFGEIVFSNGKATLNVVPGVEAKSGGAAVTTTELVSDEKGKPTKIEVGSQTFYLIKREERYGIRLKDSKNPARTEFTGEKWYPADKKFLITATLEPFPEPKEVNIPNVLGGIFKEKSPGILKFKLNGKSYTLQPIIEEDHLFIIFRDLTSRTATYGAGRFLYADIPKDGKVILDFNKAESPPCAFTEFATCPLSPPQNRLNVAIPAGEKRNHK